MRDSDRIVTHTSNVIFDDVILNRIRHGLWIAYSNNFYPCIITENESRYDLASDDCLN